jgi:hypothetical protein
MKNWIFSLIILDSTMIAPVMAVQTEKRVREDRLEMELRITPNRYTWRNYLSDLPESTRVTDVNSKNPVRQLEARRYSKYEPLNPVVLFRW